MLEVVVVQFLEHRFAVFGLGIIFICAILAAGAPLIGDLLHVNPQSQNILHRYQPFWTTLQQPLDQREEALERFIEANPVRAQNLVAPLQKIGAQEQGEEALFEVMERFPNEPALAQKLMALQNPQAKQYLALLRQFKQTHYLGTDELGRDVLMRLIYGARISLAIGLLVACISAGIGLLFGVVAGFYNGMLDSFLMRITDSLIALPLIPVLILLAAVDLKQIPGLGWFIGGGNESISKMILVLCLFSWMTVARLVRASTLSVKEKEFVLAAKTLGASDLTLIVFHIIPNILAPLLVAVTLNVGQAVLFEAALSFLGLGVQPPTPTWGNMLFNAQELIYEAPRLAILPGMLIFLLVICFNFVGDGLQDAINPKTLQR